MRNLRTFNEVTEDYFRRHPGEVDDYLAEVFDEYAQDGDSASLLASLRVIARVKGIPTLAKETGMSGQKLQNALFSKGNPPLDKLIQAFRSRVEIIETGLQV